MIMPPWLAQRVPLLAAIATTGGQMVSNPFLYTLTPGWLTVPGIARTNPERAVSVPALRMLFALGFIALPCIIAFVSSRCTG
jgi:hypothetical protein